MDSEIFDKAQAILTLRRKKAETENEERIREINEKIPQIREINEVIFNTGKELISIISNGKGKDISKNDIVKVGLEAGLSKDFCISCYDDIHTKIKVLEPYLDSASDYAEHIPFRERIMELSEATDIHI